MNRSDIDEALNAVGTLLTADVWVVVVGGASLAALGLVKRVTRDVDIIAQANEGFVLLPADPLPEELVEAIVRVARDYRLDPDWMNTVVSRQFDHGLPPGITDDIEWRRYKRLTVGFVGRASLIPLKLFAAVDQDRLSVHYQDLLALRPTDSEFQSAALWVTSQDAADSFSQLVHDVVRHAREDLGRV